MWLFFGDVEKVEPVPGGRVEKHPCSRCTAIRTFTEQRVRKTFQLYFVDVFNHDSRYLMQCEICGSTFLIDDRPEAKQDGTLAGAVASAVKRSREAMEEAQLGDKLGQAYSRTREALEASGVTERLGEAFERTKAGAEGLDLGGKLGSMWSKAKGAIQGESEEPEPEAPKRKRRRTL